MTITVHVGDQRRWGVLLANEEDAVADQLNIESERPRLLLSIPKEIPKCAATGNNVDRGTVEGRFQFEQRPNRWLNWMSGVLGAIDVSIILPTVFFELKISSRRRPAGWTAFAVSVSMELKALRILSLTRN